MVLKDEPRFDPRHTRALLEALTPDHRERSEVAVAFSELIEIAHGHKPAAWQLTADRKVRRLTLNVGQISVLAWAADRVGLTLHDGSFDPSVLPAAPKRKDLIGALKVVPGTSWVETTPAAVLERWSDLRPAVEAAIASAARIRRTPTYARHAPGAVRALEELVDRPLPDPEYLKPRSILDLLQRRYPELENLSLPVFVQEERTYKVEASQTARELLDETVLRDLLAREEHEEVIKRLQTIGNRTNLLWNSVPLQGDLAPLHRAQGVVRKRLAEEIVELLYGENSTLARLERWGDWLDEVDLPNKWTFPTYFLFLVDPERQIFVKPEVTRRFFTALGLDYSFRGRPDPWLYDWLRRVSRQLLDAFADRGAQDLIDVQSMIYVGGTEAKFIPSGDGDPEPPRPATATVEPGAPVSAEGNEGAEGNDEPPLETVQPEHPLAAVAEATGLSEDLLERWRRAIDRKGQAIVYGPPGTGKTFVAEELSRHLIGGGRGFVETVQFHPSYAYEDFIQGIRPQTSPSGELLYKVTPGIFLDLCRRARELPMEDLCVLIIDEINRANLSRVFGELMYLLEYRDRNVALPGGGGLEIPKNLRIIGTMNTADRSIALVDHALRRRFAFLSLQPDFDVLRSFHRRRASDFPIEGLIEVLDEVNQTVGDPHYAVGITYFLYDDLGAQLEDIWRMEIEPYLEEYFFDRPEKADALRWQRVQSRIMG